MPEYLTDNELEQIPKWVFNIAVVVDELLQTPGVRECFERMLWQWAEQESSTAGEKNRETIRYRIKLLPQRATTLAHDYTTLAVIHDALSEGRPINPWRGRKRSSARITSWASCFAVMIRVHVPKIADDDRERIERMVAVVRDDLRSAGLLNDELPAAEGEGEGIAGSGDAAERAPEKELPPTRHSPDFRSAHWYGNDYPFSAKQAACVRVLWEAWENRTPAVADGTILEKAGVGDRQRLRDVFKGHPAWGQMVVQGHHSDTHMLTEPAAAT